MKITLLPRTASGKQAAALSIAFVIMIYLKMRDAFPLPTFLIAVPGLAGFVVGIVVITKNKDRSILSFLSVFVGLLIVLWTAAELIYPH